MNTTAVAGLSPTDFQFLTSLVQSRSAIVLEMSKAYLVESRLLPLVSEFGLNSLTELVSFLRKPTSKQATQRVVEAMTTNETSFFRDIHPFQSLQSTLLPELIERRRSERTLNIWSNACSSGQEVYSIAMMIRHHFPELNGWKIRLMATDLSSQILNKAKEGLFNQTEVNRGLPAPMLVKFFQREGTLWRINEDIRKMIEFRELNLIEPWPSNLNGMDIIFLRNVLIYFSSDTKSDVLRKAVKTMRDDGYLFLGGAETTMSLNVPLVREAHGKASCYRPLVGEQQVKV